MTASPARSHARSSSEQNLSRVEDGGVIAFDHLIRILTDSFRDQLPPGWTIREPGAAADSGSRCPTRSPKRTSRSTWVGSSPPSNLVASASLRSHTRRCPICKPPSPPPRQPRGPLTTRPISSLNHMPRSRATASTLSSASGTAHQTLPSLSSPPTAAQRDPSPARLRRSASPYRCSAAKPAPVHPTRQVPLARTSISVGGCRARHRHCCSRSGTTMSSSPLLTARSRRKQQPRLHCYVGDKTQERPGDACLLVRAGSR